MSTLCDTSSVLLLIRIAPQMFIDNQFNCFTVREVRDEIYKNQRFKSKYSWRSDFKRELKTRPCLDIEDSFRTCLDLIEKMMETGVINFRNNRIFNLSYYDQRIIAYAITFDSRLSTNDSGMKDFIEQQFNKECLSSLALLNEWIDNNLVNWDSRLKEMMEDWKTNNEPAQPREDIEKFERLTGHQYPGL